MNILICDAITHDHVHSLFNYSIIKSIESIEYKKIILILEKNQLEQPIFKNIAQQIEHKHIYKLPSNTNDSFLARKCRAILSHYKILEIIIKEKPNLIFLLASDNLFTPITLILKNYFTKTKCIIIFHNNLENIKDSNSKQYIWKAALKNKEHSVIFLSKHIKSIFDKMNLGKTSHSISFPSYCNLLKKNNVSKDIDFLILGRHSHELNQEKLYSIFNNQIECTGSNINILVSQNITTNHTVGGVNFHTYIHPIKENLYWDTLSKAKFIIIPEEAFDRLTASGIQIDALTMGIPVIAPKTNIFLEYTPEACKALLYEKGKIEVSISNAINLNADTYNEMTKQISEFVKKISINEVSHQINAIVNTYE